MSVLDLYVTRLATALQQGANTSTRNNLPKGVSRRGNSYTASISNDYTQLWLGTFPSIASADRAYKLAANRLQGEFAAHNSRSETE